MDSDVPFHRIAPSEKGPLVLRPCVGFRKDSPHPERQKPNITGRWESVVEDPHHPPEVSWILLVNQSSTCIEGRIIEVLDGRTKRTRAIQAICGEASVSGANFVIQLGNDVDSTDSLIEVDGSDLVVTLNKGDWPRLQRFVLMPDGNRSSFFGVALDDVVKGKGPIDSETKTIMTRAETMPLHSWQVRRLQRLLDPDYLNKLLLCAYDDRSHWYTSNMEIGTWRKGVANWIQDFIHGAVTSAAPGRWHQDDLPVIRAFARTILALNRSVMNGNTRSQLQWIENLAASVRTQNYWGYRDELPLLAADLGIRNGVGAQPRESDDEKITEGDYTYELELSMHPPEKDDDPIVAKAAKTVAKAASKLLDKLPTGMKLGGALGELKITMKSKRSPQNNWIAKYSIFAGGFGFALGLGDQVDLSGKGTFVTSEEWSKRDFVGSFKILDGGAWFAPRPSDVAKVLAGGEDKPNQSKKDRDRKKQEERDWKKVDDDVEKAIEQLPGSARQVLRAGVRDVALVVNGAGNHEPQIVPFQAAKKVGAGVGASFFCSFGWIRMPDDLVSVDDTRSLGLREMQIQAQGTARAHFELGSAILTEAGREALRRLCAAELPWFLRDDTQVVLTAHCDLVRFRKNSAALAAPSGLEGSDDAKTDDPRNMQLAVYRAANVKQAIKDILADRLKIPDKLLVENPMGKKEAEEAKSKGYEPYRNPHRRRVDVTVNGRHVLTLTEA
jgi:hypothetical protein